MGSRAKGEKLMREAHVMIDLETMGTTPDAAIISVGAVIFYPDTNELGATFHEKVRVSDWDDRRICASTVKWWMEQSDAARRALFEGESKFLVEVLGLLVTWINAQVLSRGDNLFVWGNGATFDISLLENAYTQHYQRAPWEFRDVRDYRTLRHLAAMANFECDSTITVAHDALADATAQAKYAMKAMAYLKNAVSFADYAAGER